jgi:hypothetical protein
MAKNQRSIKWVEIKHYSIYSKGLDRINDELTRYLDIVQADPTVRVDYVHAKPMQNEGYEYLYVTISGRRLVTDQHEEKQS